eukprot:Amastigsp_a676751_23.p5 type:complete len:109 gc:universal Amastigsp_a676751_23:1302-1628(+)
MSASRVPVWSIKIANATRAESVTPPRVTRAKSTMTPRVVYQIWIAGTRYLRYDMAEVAETTAVEMYERHERHDARAAIDLEVVLRSSVYEPPLSGSAAPTSAYTPRNP